MEQGKLITSEIYNIKGVRRKYPSIVWWVLILVAAGLCFLADFLSPADLPFAHQLLLTLMLMVIMVFMTAVCIYMFGDSTKPYYRPHHTVLKRTDRYYDAKDVDTIIELLGNNGYDKLDQIAQSRTPSHVLITFHTPDNSFICCQLIDNSADEPTAASKIYKYNNQK